MKKLLALMLAAALALSLVACGGSGGTGDTTSTNTPSGGEDSAPSMTKEEMLEQAEEVSHSDIQNVSIENIANAKLLYCNKILKLRGTIRTINENYIVIGQYPADYVVDVYLPIEEIVTLKEGMVISVVGKTTDEILDETENVGGSSFNYSHYQMPSAYLVLEDYEIFAADKLEGAMGKTFRFTACNVSVEDGYILASEVSNSEGPIDSGFWLTGYKIYLPDEMLSKVKNGDNVDIIGIFSDDDVHEDANGGYLYIIVSPAVIAE